MVDKITWLIAMVLDHVVIVWRKFVVWQQWNMRPFFGYDAPKVVAWQEIRTITRGAPSRATGAQNLWQIQLVQARAAPEEVIVVLRLGLTVWAHR